MSSVLPPNPPGMCLCGCGKRTPIATENRRKTGDVMGHPVRFCRGHKTPKIPIGTPIPHVLCACGCGGLAPLSRDTIQKRGYMQGFPQRYIRFHSRGSAESRFWAKVRKSDGCWLWTGGKTRRGGYGHIQVQGRTLGTHVFSWQLAHGALPAPGMKICHTCDNPACVRPDHLFCATQAQNLADAAAKGRLKRKKSPAS